MSWVENPARHFLKKLCLHSSWWAKSKQLPHCAHISEMAIFVPLPACISKWPLDANETQCQLSSLFHRCTHPAAAAIYFQSSSWLGLWNALIFNRHTDSNNLWHYKTTPKIRHSHPWPYITTFHLCLGRRDSEHFSVKHVKKDGLLTHLWLTNFEIYYVGFEFPTAVGMWWAVLWNVTSYSSAGGCQFWQEPAASVF